MNTYQPPESNPQINPPVKSQLEPKKPVKKKKSRGYISLFLAFLVIVLLLFSSVLVFVLINTESEFSKYIVNNTPLGEVLNLPSGDNNGDAKIINQIIGEENSSNLEFAKSKDSLTIPESVQKSPSISSFNFDKR
jgi:hypothetical protein